MQSVRGVGFGVGVELLYLRQPKRSRNPWVVAKSLRSLVGHPTVAGETECLW